MVIFHSYIELPEGNFKWMSLPFRTLNLAVALAHHRLGDPATMSSVAESITAHRYSI